MVKKTQRTLTPWHMIAIEKGLELLIKQNNFSPEQQRTLQALEDLVRDSKVLIAVTESK
jgi:hypothetical protein